MLCVARLAGARVIFGAPPVAGRHPHRAERGVIGVDRRAPLDIEAAAREQFHRDRVIHRPRGRQAQLADGEAAHARQDAQRIHVRMLALRRAHADGAVALQQFARIEALLRRVLEVLDLQILVEIDEVLAAGMIDDRERVRGQRRAARDDRGIVPRAEPGVRSRLALRRAGRRRRAPRSRRRRSGGRPQTSRRQLVRDELLQFGRRSASAAGLQYSSCAAAAQPTLISTASQSMRRRARQVDAPGSIEGRDVERARRAPSAPATRLRTAHGRG